MAVNKFSICSEALVLVGSDPITDFDSGGAGEVIAGTLYEPTVRQLLGSYRWRFSTVLVPLSRLAVPPITNFEAAYQLPATIECLTVNALRTDDMDDEDPGLVFDRYEDQIHCNAEVTDKVIASITYRSSEQYWPAYFETLLRFELASSFAIPIAEDTDKANVYAGKALRYGANARSLDSQGRTARRLPVGGLARYHGGRA